MCFSITHRPRVDFPSSIQEIWHPVATLSEGGRYFDKSSDTVASGFPWRDEAFPPKVTSEQVLYDHAIPLYKQDPRSLVTLTYVDMNCDNYPVARNFLEFIATGA
ncbi:hypothetical protein WG66_001639 [Moniliophthora roreri]|nr:hypothetical protein WG66_001639 [Moniliophthora roreri]